MTAGRWREITNEADRRFLLNINGVPEADHARCVVRAREHTGENMIASVTIEIALREGDPDGPVCEFCRRREHTKLCDFRVRPGHSCNARMCDLCATRIADAFDLCPPHDRETERVGKLLWEKMQ